MPDSAKKHFKKPECALRYINQIDPPGGSHCERVDVHINEPLTEAEKTTFTTLLHRQHGTEWFGCACWKNGGLCVRISLRVNQHLADARIDLGRHINQVLTDIFKKRFEAVK